MPTKQEPNTSGTPRTRALIVLDAAAGGGQNQQDEFEHIVHVYEKRHGLPLDASLRSFFETDNADRTELVIFDWGGMSLGNNLLEHQIRALTRWAADHPSGLVIIRSRISWVQLQNEIEDEQLPALPNMIVDEPGMSIPEWWTAGRAAARRAAIGEE